MDNALAHYGVLGMKWGVRKDRQLTRQSAKAEKKAAQKRANQEKKAASKVRGTMTDDELRARIQRLQLEKQLRELTEAEVSPGKKFVKEVMRDSGKQAATQVSKNAMLYAGKAFVGKGLGQQDLANALFGNNGGSEKKDNGGGEKKDTASSDSDSNSGSKKEKKTKAEKKEDKKQAKQEKKQAKQDERAQNAYNREYEKQRKRSAKAQARADARADAAWEAYYKKAEEEERRRRAAKRGLGG